MRILSLSLAVSAMILPAASAGLDFDQSVKTVNAQADTKLLEVLFPFKNTTSKTIHITKYDAPCSCMSAVIKGGSIQSDKTVKFAAGEEGVVKGIFDLGNAKGKLNKKIMLWAADDSADKPSMVLEARVTIPKLIEASPKSLSWPVGSEPTTKTISIVVHDKKPIRIVKHAGSSPKLSYELKTVKEGFQYELVVTPESTEKPLFGAVRLSTDSKNPRFKSLQTFMTVKPARK